MDTADMCLGMNGKAFIVSDAQLVQIGDRYSLAQMRTFSRLHLPCTVTRSSKPAPTTAPYRSKIGEPTRLPELANRLPPFSQLMRTYQENREPCDRPARSAQYITTANPNIS